MFNTEHIVSLEYIYSKINDYDIFSYYLGFKPIIGKLYSSPFRVDKNPSFGLYISRPNGFIMYKDLGNDFQGNSINFVSKLYNLKLDEVLSKIYKEVILSNPNTNIEVKMQNKPIYKPIERFKCEIGIKPSFKDFSSLELDYWKKYGIGIRILKRFNVSNCDRVFIDYGSRIRIIRSDENNPLFVYNIGSRYKVYMPLSREKWAGNFDGSCIQGYEQLEFKQNTLIITKSLKDVMVLYKLGYEAIAPNSENTRLPEEIVQKIKSHYKNIVIFYDNDEAGIKAAKKLSEELKIDYFIIKDKTKDISDTYEEYGKEFCKNFLIKNLSKYE